MLTIQWIIAIIFLLIGGFFSIANWTIVWWRIKAPWIPIVGGGSIATGLIVIPLKIGLNWILLPLFLDFGCVPGFVFSAFYYFFVKRKRQHINSPISSQDVPKK